MTRTTRSLLRGKSSTGGTEMEYYEFVLSVRADVCSEQAAQIRLQDALDREVGELAPRVYTTDGINV